MFKYLFLLSFAILLNAETIYNGKCVDNYYTYDNSTLIIEYSSGRTIRTTESKSKIQELVSSDGFFFYNDDTYACESALKKYYGLNEMQFNFLSGLTGLLCAFLIVSAIQKRI